ncbi:MAG: hypothetical protein ACOYT8_01165 [Candidatus Dependentiae bacterium]
MRIFSVLMLCIVLSSAVNAAPGLLFFLIDKNNIRIESYSLEELQTLKSITNKVSSSHCKQILKVGNKTQKLQELSWDDSTPDRLLITFQGKQLEYAYLQLSALFNDWQAFKAMQFVPGTLYLLEDAVIEEVSYRTNLLLQLSTLHPELKDIECLFERSIAGGCIFLVENLDDLSMAYAKKSLTRQDIDSLELISLPESESIVTSEELSVIDNVPQAPTVVTTEEVVEQSEQEIVAVTAPIIQEPEVTIEPAAVAQVVAPQVKPLSLSWYSYLQIKFAALMRYFNKLLFR